MVHNKQEALKSILLDAKNVALRYYRLTKKPLGITGEVAEYEAANILGLTLCEVRQAGYDATELRQGNEYKIQIKGRYMSDPKKISSRIGAIDISKSFDSVMLVLLDKNFDAFAIYEASRERVIAALVEPGSRARNERNQLGIAKFKSISTLRWSRAIAQENG